MAEPLSWLVTATHIPSSGSGGGMQRYTMELVTQLSRRSDVDVHVVCEAPSRPAFAALLDNTRIHTVRPVPTVVRSGLEWSGVLMPAFRERFDVVHGTKHLLPLRHSGRSVLTLHDMLLLDRPADFGFLKRTLLQRPFVTSIRQADLLICVSEATRARLLNQMPELANKVRAVPIAPAATLTLVAAVPVKELAGRAFALVVGEPLPRKNIDLLIRCWPAVRKGAPELTLAMVGSRAPRDSRFSTPGDVSGIWHLGHRSDGELRWCYENARVILCPSLAEGFGLPAAEAAMFKAPVITSDDPALIEACGSSGVHLPANDTSAWTAAIIEAGLTPPRPPASGPCPSRTWAQVAEETVAAVVADQGRSGP